jgi:hypothetical protein
MPKGGEPRYEWTKGADGYKRLSGFVDGPWECECAEPVPGWWGIECSTCRRPILALLRAALDRGKQ